MKQRTVRARGKLARCDVRGPASLAGLVLLLLSSGNAATYCDGRTAGAGFASSLTEVSEPRAGQLPYFKGLVMDPYWPAEPDTLPDDLRGMRDFRLTTQDGQAFTPTDVRGRYSLVNFFYATCNGICPVLTTNIRTFSRRIDDQTDLQLLSITVDPERDDASALRIFRKKYGIVQTNWTFLTGPRLQIESLARDQFAGEVQTREGQGNLMDFVHTENLFLLDKSGYLRGIYRARGTGDLERLLIELRTLRESG